MPQFPPLPRVHFDPFGSLTSGYLMGSELAMKRSQHELERAKAEVELRDRLAKQMALQQYADTGDISYLRRYSPEVEHGIRLSQAQEQIQRLHGAREYMITVLPFLTRSQVPQLYKTLQERFGIDTSGWSVPETDEQFEIAKQQLWGRLTGKSEGGHVVLGRDPETGQMKIMYHGAATPHIYKPEDEYLVHPGGPPIRVPGKVRIIQPQKEPTTGFKLYRHSTTGELSYIHPSKASPEWQPVDKPTDTEIAKLIMSNEKLSKEYAKAVLAGQGKEFLEEFKRSTGVPGAPPAPQVPKTKEEALKRKQELQKQLEELRALERSLR